MSVSEKHNDAGVLVYDEKLHLVVCIFDDYDTKTDAQLPFLEHDS